MAQGPSLQGQIVINTKSVDRAINSIKKLQVNVGKAFGGGSRQAERFAKSLSRQSQTYSKVANDSRKYSSAIAKAANTVANYEASVRKSNIADSKKASLVKAATAQLKGFESAVKGGATSGKALNNVTTQLNVSLGQLRRDLSSATTAERDKLKSAQRLEKAQIKNEKAISSASQQYARAEAAIRGSTMAEADKVKLLSTLDNSHKKLTNTLNNNSSSVRKISTEQNKYKETLNQVNIATKKSSSSLGSAGGATNSYADEMRNLSTSVQFALGPLSGVAARITALTTLFNRNAASVAAIIASMTAFTVLFTQSAKVAQEAEKQMFRVNAQLEQMGESATVTGEEINAMAHEIAAGTLLSAQQVRDASSALIEFSGVARTQFQAVIETAQGMSAVFGGNLQSNIRRLGRAIEDPIGGMSRLEQTGVILTETTKEQIESLVAQGRAYEATNRLLEETASLQDAAKAEAKGLAGAYDTVSGNLDKLYEDLFLNSGAAENMAQSVMEVADAIAEFAKTDEAQALGDVFAYIAKTAGTAFKTIIQNADAFAGVLAFIVGSIVPKVVIGLATMGATLVGSVATGAKASAVSLGLMGTAAKKAAADAAVLNGTLNKNPFIAVASGVVALATAIWGYNEAMEAAQATGNGFNDATLRHIKSEIIARDELSKKQADAHRATLERLGIESDAYEDQLSSAEANYNSLRDTAIDALGEMTRKGGPIPRNWLNDVEGITKILGTDLTSAQDKVVRKLLASQLAVENTEDAMENLTKRTEEFLDTVQNGPAELPQQPAAERLENIFESLKEKAKNYLPDETETKELQRQLEILELNAKALDKMRGEVEGANEAYALSQRLAAAVRKELEEISQVDVSKEFENLVEDIKEAKREAALFAAQVGKTDDEKAILELESNMRQLGVTSREAFAAMSGGERGDIAAMLPGVEAGAGVDKLSEAYVNFMKQQQLSIMASENEMAANETLKTFRESQRTELQATADQYMKVYRAAKLVGDEEAAQAAKTQFKEDDERLQREARDIAKTPFSDLDQINEDYELRKQLLAEKYAGAEEQYKEHLDNMKKQAERKKTFMEFADSAQEAGDIVASAMQAMETAGKENTKAYQAMAVIQATIAGAVGIAKIWGADSVNPAIAIAKTALIAANVGAQIAAIKSQSFATGGRVQGPGTSTSDSIPANLSDGEYVIKADAARQIGLRNLDMMNSGNMPSFNQGGNVGMMPVGMPVQSGGSDGKIDVTVIDNSDGDKKFTAEESVGPDGIKKLKVTIDSVVKDSINRGNYDGNMAAAYGLRRGKKN